MPCGCLDIKTREEQIDERTEYYCVVDNLQAVDSFQTCCTYMPRVKLGNLPCFEETPGGPFDEWV